MDTMGTVTVGLDTRRVDRAAMATMGTVTVGLDTRRVDPVTAGLDTRRVDIAAITVQLAGSIQAITEIADTEDHAAEIAEAVRVEAADTDVTTVMGILAVDAVATTVVVAPVLAFTSAAGVKLLFCLTRFW